jgi:putative ABC transport system ATP-binding protein
VIAINNLKKKYLNPETGIAETVLHVPILEIKDGEHFAIHGVSGIGKTTLLHIISGLLTAEEGSIIVNNQALSSMSESERDRFRAENIGYIFQSFNLLDGYTALENVMLGMVFTGQGADKIKATIALESVGLSHRLHYKPSQLSVGQQQRVSIARAIVNNPQIILADEPTGNLDPTTSEEVMKILLEQAKGKILIVVTHENEILAHFDKKIDLLHFKPTHLPE